MSADRVGIGHGKLLLFGEHSAVYGHPACGITLPTKIRLQIADIPADTWGLPDMSTENRHILSTFLQKSEDLLPSAGSRPGAIRIESDIPQGLGFGSSSAWCVAFVRAMLGADTPAAELWETAHRAEGFFHGTPSGIDTGLAVLNGLYAFTPSPPALPGTRRLAGFPMHLIVGAVPRIGSTRKLIADLRARFDSGDAAVKDTIEYLGALSAEAIEVLAAADSAGIGRIGRLATDAHKGLRRLGLSTPPLDHFLSLGRNAGALGGKLSGAGGGGAFYLLFEEPATADRALREIKEAPCPEGGAGAITLFRLSWPKAHENRRCGAQFS
jgi:mevalonate kinase